MNRFLGGAALVLFMIVILQHVFYSGRVDLDSVELPLPDTVLVVDTFWLEPEVGIVQGDAPVEIDIDSLLAAWESELGDSLRAAIEAGWQVGDEIVGGDSLEFPVADSSLASTPGFLRSGAVLPVSARLASLDTLMVGLCRLQVDYVLPPYNLWRVRVSERFEITKTVTIKKPYAVPVYPKWSVEAMFVGGKLTDEADKCGKLTDEADKYRVGFLGGIYHKRAGLVFGLDTQGYWLGFGYRWRLGKGGS